MDVAHPKPAVKPSVAVVHEDRVIHRLDHAGLLGRARQVLVVLLHLGPQQQPGLVLFQCLVIRQLLPTSLHGKITLTQRNNRLARVCVLDHQVAGVARKPPILDAPLRPRTDAHHFEDLLEMVFNAVLALQTRFLRLFDDRQKMTKFGILQHAGQIAGRPAFVALRVHALDTLERVLAGWDWQLLAHNSVPVLIGYCVT